MLKPMAAIADRLHDASPSSSHPTHATNELIDGKAEYDDENDDSARRRHEGAIFLLIHDSSIIDETDRQKKCQRTAKKALLTKPSR